MVKRSLVVACVLTSLLALAPAASAQGCSRAVVFTLPGTTWRDIAGKELPALHRAIDEGAIASMSVRTNSSRTTYASGFATIGAGTRMDGGVTTGGTVDDITEGNVTVAGLPELRLRAEEAGYGGVPGALGEQLESLGTAALGNADVAIDPSAPIRPQRWTLLAAMDASGTVDEALVGPSLLDEVGGVVRTDAMEFAASIREVLADPCGLSVIDQGDLLRAELAPGDSSIGEARRAALVAADEALAAVLDAISPEDLLLVVSPTSPAEGEVHFGVAIARGPGFAPGAILSSASTRRKGIVTLRDVAPTVLTHMGLERHPAMLGRPFFGVAPPGDRLGLVVEDDEEATFVDRIRVPVTTAFVIGQVLIYLLIAFVLYRAGLPTGSSSASPRRWPELTALGVVAFPAATYLAGALPQHELGLAGYVACTIAITVAMVAVVARLADHALDRLLIICASTCALLLIDVMIGGRLQVNTVFSYSPLVAGRFAGFGNTAFAVLGAVAVITATLLVHRGNRSRRSLWAAAVVFGIVVVVDGAPMWGSDVGGVLALVPAFGLTFMLLQGKKPNAMLLAIVVVATLAVLGAFLAFDLARSPEQQTHLGRLFQDVRARGSDAFMDTVGRKIETNLRVFTSTIWTYFVPPALAFIAWLLLRPKKRWEGLASEYPTLRAGLIGGLIVSVFGFAVNDSGIVVPAMVLSYLVPTALLIHLLLEKEART